MHAFSSAGAGFPALPNLAHGEGDDVSIAVAVLNQPAGVTYSATGLPVGLHVDNENFTDTNGIPHSRGVLRGTLRRGAPDTDPVRNAGSYSGDEGVYTVTVSASDGSVSNAFSWDIGRWGSGDVFVGGGTSTYQIYTKDGDFKYDVRLGGATDTQMFTTGCAANWHTGEVWATNFDNDVNVITRHTSDPSAPYTNAARKLSTIRSVPGGVWPIDENDESITFDNAQNMYVGHSFGWSNNNGDAADINGKAVWLDDTFTLAWRFNSVVSYVVDWNAYKTTPSPGPGVQYDDGGNLLPGTYPYAPITPALWNEAKTAWGLINDWNVHKQDGAGLITVDAAGAPILSAGNQYIPFDMPVSPDGFYETWVGGVAQYVLTSLGAKIPIREQYGMDIHKYPAAPAGYGNDVAHFPTTYSNVRYGFTGADALDLLNDQQTMLYSSENQYLYRFNVATGTQLPVVGSTALSSGASLVDVSHPITADPIYGVRVLPPGDGTGGYLVGTEARILRLDRNGAIIQTYDATNDPDYPGRDADGWFSLAIAPDGRSFWAATRQDVYHFDIASSAILGSKIHATDGIVHTSSVVDGLCVMNEYRAARENCGVDGKGNGLDDDGDGVIDNGCFKLEICSLTSPGDDDGNGLVDFNDPACYAPGSQPPTSTCALSGPTDPSVGGFCARQNAEGDAVDILAVPLPCSGAACDTWTFSYVATGLPPGLTMNSVTGEVTGTPAYAIVANNISAAPVVFNVSVVGTWTQTGQLPSTMTTTFKWTITNTNRPPVAVNDTARAQAGASVLIDVLANDTDPDATDTRSINAASLTTPMDASLVPRGTVSIVSGKLQYNAPAGFSGVVTFFYQAQDNYGVPGVSNQAKVTVTVNGAPVANDDTYTMTGGTSLTVNAANGIIQNAAGRDTDPEGTALTVATSTATAHGSITVNPDGSFSYTPLPGFTGTDTFTYKVTDGEAQSNVATVTIIVPAPPVAVNDSYSTQVNTALNVTATWDGVLGNDTDPRGLALLVSSNTNPSHGTLVMSPTKNGTFTYTPATGFSGVDTFTYVATNGGYTSNTATVTISIVSVNNPPVAANDSYVVNAGSTLTVAGGDILRNDSDPDHDLLTATLVSAPTQPGAFAFTPNTGGFTYTPAPGVIGNVTFTYKVSDPYGLSSANATVTIIVNAVPVAVNDSYTTAEDTVLTIAAAGILANDTDQDAGSTRTVVLPLLSQPTHGTITQNANGSFVYTPALNYNGPDSYTYQAVDNRGAVSNVATVNITVTPVNDAPVAVADSFTMLQGQTLTVAAAQGFIQRNDTDVDDNVTALRATLVSTVGHGSLQFGTDGSFTYVPTASFSGTDTFTYFDKDAAGATSNTVTVTIIVTPTSLSVTATPVCSSNAAYVDYSVSAVNFTFPTGTTTQIDWVDSANRIVRTDLNQPLSGRALWPGTTLVLGLPVDWPGWLLSGVLWLEGIDGFELTKPAVTMRFTAASKTKEVSVTYPLAVTGCSANPPLNQAPVASNDSYVTTPNTAITVPAGGILTNDRDPEGGALTVNLPVNTTPAHGTLVQNADGSLVYTPATGFFGTDSYAYRAKDVGGALSNLATVTITVLGSTTVLVPNVTATYDGLSHATTCTVTGADGSVLLGSLSYSPALSVHAGTYTATCTYIGDGRFASASATGTVKIMPKPLTITANSSSKVYGTTPVLGTTAFTSVGLASGDSITGVTLASTGTAANATVAGSTYPIVPSAAVMSNLGDYTVSYANGALTVTKAPLTITANSASKIFGSTLTFAGTEFTTSALVSGDSVTSAALASTGAVATAAAGSYAITPSLAVGTGLANYTITYVNGTLTVGKPVITVTASNASVTYGDAKPAITPSYAGFVNGDTAAVVTTAPVCTTTYTTTSTVGSSPSTSCSGAGAANYTFVYVNGSVAIAPKAATVTAGSGSKAFGASDPSLTTTQSGLSSADLAGITLATTRAAGEAIGTYVTTATATGGNVGNYAVTYVPGTFTITKATPIAVATGGTFIFDGAAHAGTCTVTGVGGAALTGTLTYTGGTTPVAVGTYTVTCSFAGDATYNPASATATITITSANHAPVAVNDAFTATKNTKLTIALPGVKVNDSDADGDTFTAELVSAAGHGVVVLASDGSFTYTPASNYTGVDTFTYKVKDSKGAYSNVATVTITITAVACNLSAIDDTYETNKNHSITIIANGGVLTNDQDPYHRGMSVSKVNGSSSKVGVTTATSHGTIKLNVDGSFTYTPASNYSGADTFTYEMKSGYNGAVDTATVTITVNAHYDGDGCDHDRHRNGHNDGDHCSHDKALDRHYNGDDCDHDNNRGGHHNGDGCEHDRDVHRHFNGDYCDHERRRNGHYSGDDCSHSKSTSKHYDGDGCDHDADRNGHRDGDKCDHDQAVFHHNDGDDCDHEARRNGHAEGDKCDHDQDDHGHNDGDGCDHDRGRNGHYNGDRCEHDEHRGDDDNDDNACVVTTGNSGQHHSGGHDDQHHTGDFCDHERKRNGHYTGDGCEHDRVSKHSGGDYCDHDRHRNGHYDGDGCDHDKSQRSSKDWSWSWRDRD